MKRMNAGSHNFSLPFLLAVAIAIIVTTPALSDDAALPGKTLATERSKGNCLACHTIADGELAGNMGPPLLAMQARFPDRERLRAQIFDASINNRHSRMPPFGRHQILTNEEIELIMDYLYTL